MRTIIFCFLGVGLLLFDSASTLPPYADIRRQSSKYYLVDLEISSNSDWARVDMNDLQFVTWRKQLASNMPAQYHLAGRGLFFERSSSEQKLPEVKLTVRYVMSKQDLCMPFTALFQRGDSSWTRLAFKGQSRAGSTGGIHYTHDQTIPDGKGTNQVTKEFDLCALADGRPFKKAVRIKSRRPRLYAFFYPWYQLDYWDSEIIRDEPAARYDSSETETIAAQISSAQKAGIDGFISSWWGPGHKTDTNLKTLLQLSTEKRFKTFIYFETLEGETQQALDETTIQTWLDYAITNYGSHPAYLKYEGKPVIAIWMAEAVLSSSWARVFAALRAENKEAFYIGSGLDGDLELFDALHIYGIQEYDSPKKFFAKQSRHPNFLQLLTDTASKRLWIATVEPGYDDTLLPGRVGYIRARDQGVYYRSTWQAAVASRPDWIFITSWNEYWENTHIEASKNYGKTYLQITRHEARKWKNSPGH